MFGVQTDVNGLIRSYETELLFPLLPLYDSSSSKIISFDRVSKRVTSSGPSLLELLVDMGQDPVGGGTPTAEVQSFTEIK